MINFDERTHTYEEDGKELISVTTLLKKHHLGVDYGDVSPEVLKRASERGTLIHEEVERYAVDGIIGFTDEAQAFAKWFDENVDKVLGCEKIVGNDICAGRYDLFVLMKNGKKVRIDVKTTYTPHRSSTSWQLSIYDNMDVDKADEVAMLHLRGNECKYLPLSRVNDDRVEELLNCERKGEIFENKSQCEDYIDELVALMEQRNKLEQQIKELQDKINPSVKELGTFKNNLITISYVAPSSKTKVIFDEAKFKAEHEDTYKMYCSESVSTTKESFRYTLKGSK